MKNIFGQVIGLIIAAAIIIMGITVTASFDAESANTVSIGTASTDYCAFGGDFYTEIHAVTRAAVKQLNDMSNGLEAMNGNILKGLEKVVKGIGMAIIAGGLALAAHFVCSICSILSVCVSARKEMSESPVVTVSVNTETVTAAAEEENVEAEKAEEEKPEETAPAEEEAGGVTESETTDEA